MEAYFRGFNKGDFQEERGESFGGFPQPLNSSTSRDRQTLMRADAGERSDEGVGGQTVHCQSSPYLGNWPSLAHGKQLMLSSCYADAAVPLVVARYTSNIR